MTFRLRRQRNLRIIFLERLVRERKRERERVGDECKMRECIIVFWRERERSVSMIEGPFFIHIPHA